MLRMCEFCGVAEDWTSGCHLWPVNCSKVKNRCSLNHDVPTHVFNIRFVGRHLRQRWADKRKVMKKVVTSTVN